MTQFPSPSDRSAADANSSPVAWTRHGELTLDQIGTMQMGLARLMREYSDRFWACYYAARGGNWLLATYMLNNILKLHQYGGQTRPNMKPWLDRFEQEHVQPLVALSKAGDWDRFEAAYHVAVDAANGLHGELGYPYIQWTLPAAPPPHLTMQPPEESPTNRA